MIHYALCAYRQHSRGPGYMMPPVNAIGAIDLRDLPGHAGTDFVFSALDDTIAPIDNDDLVVATAPAPVHDLSIAIAANDRTAWADAIGVQLTGSLSTLADLLAATFLAGDPTGETALKPLVPTGDKFEIHLGGHSLVWSRRVSKGDRRDPFAAKAMEVRRADLMRITDPILRGKLITDILAKGGHEISREAAKAIIGIDEKPLPRRTSYSDDFNRADSGSVGGSWTETETTNWSINSNMLRITGVTGDAAARYDADVSSTDHICDAVFAAASTSTGFAGCGPTVRHSASAETFYYAYLRAGANLTETWKQVTNTHTQLGTSTAFTPSLPDTVRARCAGSTITRYVNGISQQANTDSAISGGTRGGVYSYPSSASTTHDLDDWTIDDEVASPAGNRRRRLFIGSSL